MNYAQIRKLDIANGEGVRTTLFVSGCRFACPGCFNAEYWDFSYGKPWTKEAEDEFILAGMSPRVAGYSILGGEPLQQDPAAILYLVQRIKAETGKSIWLWTGYTWETLDKQKREIVAYCDVLVDGLFIEAKKDARLAFRGSQNQRVILVKPSLEAGTPVLWENQYAYEAKG